MPDKIYDFVGDARATFLYTREAFFFAHTAPQAIKYVFIRTCA